MRVTTLTTGLLAAILLIGCGGYSAPTSPDGNPTPGNGGDGGGGPNPSSVTVTVGNIFFRSGANGSVNAAVDKISVGGTVTWTWVNNGNVPHSVRSLGSPGFTSSAIQSATGSSYEVTFPTAGVYHYDCAVHGSAMSGTITVE